MGMRTYEQFALLIYTLYADRYIDREIVWPCRVWSAAHSPCYTIPVVPGPYSRTSYDIS